MKNQGRIFLFAALLGAGLVSCNKNDQVNQLSLKEAVNQGSQNLNTAMEDISSTRAYTIFTMNDGTLKSGTTTDPLYRVYIPLEKIKGVFDYKPVPRIDRHGMSIIQFFNQTADNSQMIVRMPLSKVTNPRSLRHYSAADSALTNNFTIAVSDYHNNYNSFWIR